MLERVARGDSLLWVEGEHPREQLELLRVGIGVAARPVCWLGTRPAALDIEPQFVPAPKRRKMIDTLSVPHGKLGAKPAKPTARAHLIPAIADQVRTATVQMDRKSFDQMKRGKL